MKLTDGFITHQMNNEQVMVDVSGKNFSGVVKSNSTAAFIVECFKKDVTVEDVVDALLEEYDVSREQAEVDVNKVVEKLKSIGALTL